MSAAQLEPATPTPALPWGTRVRVTATDRHGYVQLHYVGTDRYFIRHSISHTGVYARHELEVIHNA